MMLAFREAQNWPLVQVFPCFNRRNNRSISGVSAAGIRTTSPQNAKISTETRHGTKESWVS